MVAALESRSFVLSLTIPQANRIEPVKFAPSLGEKEDISKYYDVANEVRFLMKYGSQLTPEESQFYIEQSQYKFLGEFVGHVPITKISYLLNSKNGLNFAGINLAKMLNTTNNERVNQENQGVWAVARAFEKDYEQGEHMLSQAAIISPPKDWDYGFVFYYEKKFNPELESYIVEMIPLRYDEERNQLVNSLEILRKISPSLTERYKTAEDFLSNPVFTSLPDLDTARDVVGIDFLSTQKAKKFEDLMQRVVGSAVEEYARQLVLLSEVAHRLSREELFEQYESLDIIRRGIFNKAAETWEIFNNTHERIEKMEDSLQTPFHLDLDKKFFVKQPFSQQEMHYYASKGPSVIIGGGSCPTTTSNSDPLSMADKLNQGISLESQVINSLSGDQEKNADKQVTCPGCGKVVRFNSSYVVSVGRLCCPHCSNSVNNDCDVRSIASNARSI